MSERPSLRTFIPPTRAELVERVREAKEKADTLVEARLKAHDEMRQVSGQYEFLVAAERHAFEELENARHAVESEIRRETWAATGV